MDLDVEAYGRWLLDWLYDQPESQRVAEAAKAEADGDRLAQNMLYNLWNDTGRFFGRLGLPGITGHPVVARLKGQGWVDLDSQYDAEAHLTLMEDGSDPMEQDVKSPRARITSAGIDVARQNRASRRDAVPVDTPLTNRILRWLYRETVGTGGPANLVKFLPSDYAIRDGALGFTLREVQDAARYLHEKGLVTDPGSQPVRGLGQQLLELTSGGRECHNGHNANVSQYLERSTAVVTIDSGSARQHINEGVPLAEALRFADFVSQVAPVLHPVEGTPADFTALADDVRAEATRDSPDKRRLRRLIDALIHALETAGPEAVVYTSIDLGEKAIHALSA